MIDEKLFEPILADQVYSFTVEELVAWFSVTVSQAVRAEIVERYAEGAD